MIENTSGKQMKNLISLIGKGRTRNEQGLFVAEGVRILSEAPLESVERIYVSESFIREYHKEEYYPKIRAVLDEKGWEVLSDKVFAQVTDTKTPQGIMAVLKMPVYDFNEQINRACNVLFLDEVRDPGNLGTIIRTAEGAGFSMLVMSKGCVDIFNPKVVRSTMGAVYRLPFVYVDSLQETLSVCKDIGFEIYAAHLDGTDDYAKIEYAPKTGIIIGNEANGICDEVKAEATKLIRIPMEGKVESLNAAIAAAVLMYEVYRRKRL